MSNTRLAFTLLLLATLATACASFRPRPVGYASMAVVCAPHRVVYCATDTEPKHCAAVAAAVAEIDATVDGLMEYRGRATWADIVTMREHGVPVTVVADIPRELLPGIPGNVLAVTMAKPDPETVCLGFTPIALLWEPGTLSQERVYAVILHELMHSLGAEHADGTCHWQTIMDRAPTHHGLSWIDRNWLSSVYGR